MKNLNIFGLSVLMLILSACGGGGGDPETGDSPLSISNIPNQQAAAGETKNINFTVTGEGAGEVTATDITATSSDQAIVEDSGLAVSGAEGSFSLAITPTDAEEGSADIALSATADGETATEDFTFTIGDGGTDPGTGNPGGADALPESGTPGYGKAVAVSGDYAAVGAPQDSSVYVYQRSGDGWTLQTTLTPDDVASSLDTTPGNFGWSVALDGDSLLVGAPLTSSGDSNNTGAVYGFRRSGNDWGNAQIIRPTSRGVEDRFGWSVAADGDFIIVGAFLDDDNGTDSGRAFVFQYGADGGNPNIWVERDQLLPSDVAAGSQFGASVGISNGYAVVGAPNAAKTAGTPNSGTAYVFQYDNSREWNEVQKLTASDAGEGDRFGRAVAIDGDYIVIGSFLDDNNGDESGSVYVYELQGAAWESVSEAFTPADGAADDQFGRSVAISNGTALVGAYRRDDGGTNGGTAYLLDLSGVSVTSELNNPGAEEDKFGASVALSADALIIGAYDLDNNIEVNGSAYIYAR